MLDKPHRHETALTAREMHLLRLLTQGLSDKAIGREVGISSRTAECHAGSILKKMGVSNRAHAAALAVGLGMVRIVEPLRT